MLQDIVNGMLEQVLAKSWDVASDHCAWKQGPGDVVFHTYFCGLAPWAKTLAGFVGAGRSGKKIAGVLNFAQAPLSAKDRVWEGPRNTRSFMDNARSRLAR